MSSYLLRVGIFSVFYYVYVGGIGVDCMRLKAPPHLKVG